MAIPLLVGFLSAEGVFDATTFNRYNIVTATATTSIPAENLRQNLATPFAISSSDDWLLSLFPMPYKIEANSLAGGDVHRAHTRYHRWFFTNTHEGVIELRVDAVAEERVQMSFVNDSSFFSSYVRLIGTDILFVSDSEGMTEVSMTISYERRLDPAWYFQPIQQYAMRAMANHLIAEVVIRDY